MNTYDIPVLFQVRAKDEKHAALLLANVLADTDITSQDWLEDNDSEIESWHMPNHKDADGSDIPVTVEIVIDEKAYAERQNLLADIARIAGVTR